MCEDCGVYQDLEDLIVTPRSRLICRARLDCQTRMRLKSKQIIEQVTRSDMSQETSPVVDNDQYIKKAKALAAEAFNNDFPVDQLTKAATKDDFYVVWFAKTLGNWKALVSTDIYEGAYFEVTYDGNKKQTYIDFYFKRSNICITDMDYHRMVTPMSERNYEFRNVPGVANDVTVSRDGDIKIGGRINHQLTNITKWDGTSISIQMAVHLAFPDIPMRNIPKS